MDINWKEKSKEPGLTEEFIEKYSDKVYWDFISQCQNLSEEFIEKYSDKFDWYYISIYQKLSEKFIEKYSDKVYWDYISINQKLSEEFIEKHSDKVFWNNISINQKLSEKFIEKFSDKVNWINISIHQKLSEKFIEKHSDKVDWYYISQYQILSKEFIEKNKLQIPETCWIYKTPKEKLQYIKEKEIPYELSEDESFIIAYKSVKNDGYSVYNFQYHYEIGNTYESHCDCNVNNENSFGLSSWTKEKALEYYNKGKLFKVKIMIEDIGCFVHKDNKIRCRKLEMIEEI